MIICIIIIVVVVVIIIISISISISNVLQILATGFGQGGSISAFLCHFYPGLKVQHQAVPNVLPAMSWGFRG